MRLIRLLRPPHADEPGVLALESESKIQFYVFREIPCAIGGRGFAIHRLGLGNLYHVRVGKPIDLLCECMGFYSRGNCKHLKALLALTGHGLI